MGGNRCLAASAAVGVLAVAVASTPISGLAARGSTREGTLSISVTGFVGMAGGPAGHPDTPSKGPVRITITSVVRKTVLVRHVKELPGEVVLRLQPGRYEVETSCEANKALPATVKSGRRTAIPITCGTSIK